MQLIVEVNGVLQHQSIPHVGREILTVEVVVPSTAFWNHEESKEFIAQNHLNLLKKARIEVGWVGLNVFLVYFAPFDSQGCQLIY